MKDIRIISGKRIVPSLKTVTALLGAKNTGAAQSQIQSVFEQMLPAVQMRVRAKAALTVGELPPFAEEHSKSMTKKALYVMLTIGDGVSRLAEKYTAGNDMLKAMIVDAMADSCLFAFEEQLLPAIRQICLEEGYGVAGRLELMQDVEAGFQKVIFDVLHAERTLNLSLTSGYMLLPEKSMSLLFELTEDTAVQCVEHDCKKCMDKDCMLRRKKEILLTVEQMYPASSKVMRITCAYESNLLDILRDNNIMLPAYCGGTGTCGKCKVLLKEGSLPITPEDRTAFSEDELKQGMRLSCRAVLRENITIAVKPQEKEIIFTPDMERKRGIRSGKANAYGIAVDIGTTTLAFSLTDLFKGTTVDTHTAVNSQRSFGADVLTRMQTANAGKARQLSRLIKHDILDGIQTLLARNAVNASDLRHIAIAANTVMLHLLRGYSCEGLSSYPFAPVTLDTEDLTLSALCEDFEEEPLPLFPAERINVTLLPGMSAFVGADITAGLYVCDILKETKPALFLDLGTNGEMALKKGNAIYIASTAAGPAFEAGNIKWGMPGIPGAISQVVLHDDCPKVKTIAGHVPKGICGTGVIEAVAELCAAGLIDKTGKLKDPYFPDGFPLAKTSQGEQILLHQQDIREIQMAKAAIRAGIEILMQHSGTTAQEIGQVYLAGGFGYFLDISKAAAIGLLPKELSAKTKAAGNTPLKGAERFLIRKSDTDLETIKKSAREVSLAQDKKFQELYVKYMSFS